MKAQTKQMLAAVLILAAVLAVYMAVRTRNNQEEPVIVDEEPPLSQELLDLDDLVEVSFTATDGEQLSFRKTEGIWISEQEPELNLVQDYLEDVEDYLCELEYQRMLEDHDALMGYGLDPAVRKVSATDEDGVSCVVFLGNEVNYSGVYYAMIEGSDAVYTVSGDLFAATDFNLMELAKVEALPDLSEAAIKSLTLTTADGELVLKKLTERTQEVVEQETGELDENGQPVVQEVTSIKEIYHWSLGSGKTIPEGNTTLIAVLDELNTLMFESVYAYRPDQETMDSYALATSVTVEYADDTLFVLWLGAPDESQEYCFARQGESDLIHLVSCSGIDDLLSMTEKALRTAP